MTNANRLKMPEDYTELSYEDGELSGSGSKKWTSQDTQTAVKWGLTGLAGIGISLGIMYSEEIGNFMTRAWNGITGCCCPQDVEIPQNNENNNIFQNNDIEQNNNNNQKNEDIYNYNSGIDEIDSKNNNNNQNNYHNQDDVNEINNQNNNNNIYLKDNEINNHQPYQDDFDVKKSTQIRDYPLQVNETKADQYRFQGHDSNSLGGEKPENMNLFNNILMNDKEILLDGNGDGNNNPIVNDNLNNIQENDINNNNKNNNNNNNNDDDDNDDDEVLIKKNGEWFNQDKPQSSHSSHRVLDFSEGEQDDEEENVDELNNIPKENVDELNNNPKENVDELNNIPKENVDELNNIPKENDLSDVNNFVDNQIKDYNSQNNNENNIQNNIIQNISNNNGTDNHVNENNKSDSNNQNIPNEEEVDENNDIIKINKDGTQSILYSDQPGIHTKLDFDDDEE